MKILAKFVTSMRASSLADDLAKAGIQSTENRPKWTNKRLPPPNVEVSVSEADFEAATVVLKAFKETK